MTLDAPRGIRYDRATSLKGKTPMKSKEFKIFGYVMLVLFMMTTGIFLIFKMGYTPQPVGIMKVSSFKNPEEIGAAVYRRFYVPIDQKKIVVIGIPAQPEFHRNIVRGFLEAAAIEKRPFEVLITEAEMPVINLTGIPPLELKPLLTNTKTQSEFIDALNEVSATGKRTLVYVPSVYSSHLLEGNVVTRYEHLTGKQLFTITTGPLALGHDQEYLVDPPCLGSEMDKNNLSPLGCAIMLSSRKTYRKKHKQDQWMALMNDQKQEDYLLMVSTPGQDQAEKPQPTPPVKATSF
jgi:hypothetical protein